MPSMLSAPTIMPATSEVIFAALFAEPGPFSVRHSSRTRAAPALSANIKTGANLARDTRFGSSKTA